MASGAATGGGGAAPPEEVGAVPRPGSREKGDLEALVMEHLNGAPVTQAALARAAGRTPGDGSVRRVLARLERQGRAVRVAAGWRLPGAGDGR